MAGMKTLINRTGSELKVTLVVRKGDLPQATSETVEVHLAAAQADGPPGEDGSRQQVPYGDDVDIYLNGIETLLIKDGAGIGKREIVVERGSALDDQLNTRDTLEFLFDGQQVLWSSSNANAQGGSFAFEQVEGSDSAPSWAR